MQMLVRCQVPLVHSVARLTHVSIMVR